MKKIIASAVSILAIAHLAAAPVLAENTEWVTGTIGGLVQVKPSSYFSNKDGDCFIYPQYLVRFMQSVKLDRTDFHVFKRSTQHQDGPKECAVSIADSVFSLSSEGAKYFAGIFNDLLFVDSGTGNRREFLIYSIKDKKISKRLVYEGEGLSIEKDRLIDTDSEVEKKFLIGKPTPPCPDFTEGQLKDPSYRKSFRGIYTLRLSDFSENYSSIKCKIHYQE